MLRSLQQLRWTNAFGFATNEKHCGTKGKRYRLLFGRGFCSKAGCFTYAQPGLFFFRQTPLAHKTGINKKPLALGYRRILDVVDQGNTASTMTIKFRFGNANPNTGNMYLQVDAHRPTLRLNVTSILFKPEQTEQAILEWKRFVFKYLKTTNKKNSPIGR